MQHFRWLSGQPLPPRYDLRRRGWRLAARVAPASDIAAIPVLTEAGAGRGDSSAMLSALSAEAPPGCILILGIVDPKERAALLRAGCGDVLGPDAELAEVEARAARIAANTQSLPRVRTVGSLRLDLLAREGFALGRPLDLHPREFGLIWRLAETPGIPVAKSELMRQVWRMTHITNSIAVHIFRLRAKLGVAGLGDMVRTAPSGGYFLAPPGSQAAGQDSVDRSAWTGNTRAAHTAPRSQGHAP